MAAPALLPFRLPPPEGGRADLLVIAGEHSGDEHAARMVRVIESGYDYERIELSLMAAPAASSFRELDIRCTTAPVHHRS